jgi:hypothetical protein
VKLPSVPVIELPGGYRWVQHSIEDKAWQAHLVKHPLGIDALRRQKGLPWNNEGWDRISPPAIHRGDARAARLRCVVAELRRQALRGEGVSGRQVAEPGARVLRLPSESAFTVPGTLREGAVVGALFRGDPARRPGDRGCAEGWAGSAGAAPHARLSQPGLWSGLVVMTVGRTDRGVPALRISSSDGVRVELRILSAGQVAWRTTYRASVAGPISQFNHVRDAVTGDPRLSLSEDCFVPRDWGNRHGI